MSLWGGNTTAQCITTAHLFPSPRATMSHCRLGLDRGRDTRTVERSKRYRRGLGLSSGLLFFFFQKAGCETLTSTGLGSRVTCHDLVFTMGSARTPKEQHGNAEQRAANSARPRHHPCDFSQYSCEETQLERLLRVFSVPQFAYL